KMPMSSPSPSPPSVASSSNVDRMQPYQEVPARIPPKNDDELSAEKIIVVDNEKTFVYFAQYIHFFHATSCLRPPNESHNSSINNNNNSNNHDHLCHHYHHHNNIIAVDIEFTSDDIILVQITCQPANVS